LKNDQLRLQLQILQAEQKKAEQEELQQLRKRFKASDEEV